MLKHKHTHSITASGVLPENVSDGRWAVPVSRLLARLCSDLHQMMDGEWTLLTQVVAKKLDNLSVIDDLLLGLSSLPSPL